MGEESRISVALHEAGHAVMATIANCDIDFATIISAEDYYGVCRTKDIQLDEYAFNSYDDYKAYITNQIMVNFSGFIAAGQLEFPKEWQIDDDIGKSVELAFSITGNPEQMEKKLIEIWVKSVEIIMQPLVQQQIKAVTDALYQKGKLSGEEIQRIVKSFR